MPNWCSNLLKIAGSENAIHDFVERMTNKQIRFADLLPTPPDEDQSWQVEHWGTKWDLDDDQTTFIEPTLIHSAFQSAWSPPEEWLAHAAATFPALRFVLKYDEPGMDFAGLIHYEDGVLQRHKKGRSTSNMIVETDAVEHLLSDAPYIFVDDITSDGRLVGDIYSHHYDEIYYDVECNPHGMVDTLTFCIMLNDEHLGGQYELYVGDSADHREVLSRLCEILKDAIFTRDPAPYGLKDYASNQPDEKRSLNTMMFAKAGAPLRLQKFDHTDDQQLALWIIT